MIIGIVMLFVTLYLIVTWSGEQWLLWLSVGVGAVSSQIASYASSYLDRFRVGLSFSSPELQSRWIHTAEIDLRKNLSRAPIVLFGVALIAWLGHSSPNIGMPLQIGLDILMWLGVVVGWATALRLRMTLRKVDRRGVP